MSLPSCASVPPQPMQRGQLPRQAAAATPAWTARKDRAAAPHFPPAGTTPHNHHVAGPITNQGSRTKISMGARAHTPPHSATTAPVKRFALALRAPKG